MSSDPDYKMTSTYRPDIDGLRAIAVLSVLVFHAFPSALPGGFVGVDIFFVISGFLITDIVWRELHTGRFSFSNFYARRVRRIFPALITVLLACIGFGWWVLFEDEYKQLGNHTLSASVFLSNFILRRESGYFDTAAELKPLLHLWSLAVEEQFYIFWPAILLGICRFFKRPAVWLLALGSLSLGWNIYLGLTNPVHDFYSPFSRFWEPMAGGLVAIYWPKFLEKTNPQIQRHLGRIGIALLLASLVICQWATVYPSGWALLPVMGALCFIASRGQLAGLQRAVTHWSVLWVGEISYALYLWHWPILSFAHIIEGQKPGVNWRLAGLALSFVLAGLTTHLIERQFRHRAPTRRMVVSLLLLMTFTGTAGLAIKNSDGVPGRSLSGPDYILHDGSIGHDEFLQDSAKQEAISRAKGPADMALFGDSHAQHLFLGLSEAMPERNLTVFGVGGLPIPANPQAKEALQQLVKDSAIRTVLMVAVWNSRIEKLPAGVDFTAELAESVRTLQAAGKQVVLLDDVFEFDFEPQRCKFARPLSGGTLCGVTREAYERQTEKYLPQLLNVHKQFPSVSMIRYGDVFCDTQTCSMLSDDRMAYRDKNHLNTLGSRVAGKRVATLLTGKF